MVPDFQTSIKIIRESNESFLSLLVSLKQFLTAETEITVSCNGESITVPSLPAVIREYRGGNFDSITLRNGSGTITLANAGGALKVTGPNGLANIEAAKVLASTIASSSVTSMSAVNCTIDSLNSGATLSATTMSVQNLALSALQVAYLTLQDLSVNKLDAGSISADKLTIGQMYIDPQDIKHMFYIPGGSVYNYSSSNYKFIDYTVGSTSYKFWQCLDLPSSCKDPSTYGFYAKPSNSTPIAAPDAKYLQGNYSEDLTSIDNVGVAALGASGTGNITYSNTLFLNTPFSYVQSWPVPIYGSATAAANIGMAFLQEIRPNDKGKVFYFRTGGKSWKISRVLSLHYDSSGAAAPSSGSLGQVIEVPPYTTLRLRMDRISVTNSSGSVDVTNRLELV